MQRESEREVSFDEVSLQYPSRLFIWLKECSYLGGACRCAIPVPLGHVRDQRIRAGTPEAATGVGTTEPLRMRVLLTSPHHFHFPVTVCPDPGPAALCPLNIPVPPSSRKSVPLPPHSSRLVDKTVDHAPRGSFLFSFYFLSSFILFLNFVSWFDFSLFHVALFFLLFLLLAPLRQIFPFGSSRRERSQV